MTRLFLLHGAGARDPRIPPWFARQSSELGCLAERWFRTMKGCGEDVQEVLHDGQPTVCVAHAAFCYVGVFTKHVNVGFFAGAELPDPARMLTGEGRVMRHVKILPGLEIDESSLKELIRAAYLHVRKALEEGCPARRPSR